MKTHLANRFWKVALLLVLIGFFATVFVSHADNRGPQLVAETRQTLRQQGFKTDLADFDFSTSPELRAREVILNATVPTNSLSVPFQDHPNPMEAVGTNSAVVVWELPWLKKQYPSWPGNNDKLTWEEFRKAISSNSAPIDAACATIFSGPIVFDLNARDGAAMRLPHLAMLKNLTQTLGDRMVLDIHDGNLDTAWTNLLAATRLVTAWQTEPVEISQLVRFGNMTLAYNGTWQALQANGWSDDQLARLQQEWESVDFFTNLPATAAFKRASDVALCQQDRREFLKFRPPFSQFFKEALQSPTSAWSDLHYRRSYGDYLRRGIYEDETNLLFFYRDRELELRNAVQAPTWMRMRQLPGVTNNVFFQSKYPSRILSMFNLHELQMGFLKQGTTLLGRAAEAEARRRILITAIALERFREKHGAYPNTLSELAPEFLKTVLPDFMDGQPLRYRLAGDGHFLHYSVGLDCVDDGGKFPTRPKGAEDWQVGMGNVHLLGTDILWPLPASPENVAAQQKRESKEKEERAAALAEREKAQEMEAAKARQDAIKKLLAMKPAFNKTEPTFEGKPLTEILRNSKSAGANKLTVDELLTLKQIVTGQEPDIATFESPVSYDALKDRGELRLSVDGGAGAELEDCTRATNGDCLLEWNTDYEPPGQHALQAQLLCHEPKRVWQEIELKGPVTSYYSSNLVQFFEGDSMFTDKGATLYGKLPESNGIFSVELKSLDGRHLKTMSGTTSNGIINVEWNLIDDQGNKYTNESFNAIYNIALPDSGRSQTTRGP